MSLKDDLWRVVKESCGLLRGRDGCMHFDSDTSSCASDNCPVVLKLLAVFLKYAGDEDPEDSA